MGTRLKRLREAAGLSQSDLAKVSSVPIGTLRNWEQDRRTPTLDTAARVAKAMGVSLDELAGGITVAPPPPAESKPRGRPPKARPADAAEEPAPKKGRRKGKGE